MLAVRVLMACLVEEKSSREVSRPGLVVRVVSCMAEGWGGVGESKPQLAVRGLRVVGRGKGGREGCRRICFSELGVLLAGKGWSECHGQDVLFKVWCDACGWRERGSVNPGALAVGVVMAC